MNVLALTNGTIWTGAGFAQTVLIRGNRIAALDALVPEDARVIDLKGRLVVPGFIDNHLHFVTGSLQLGRVQLRDAASPEQFAERIAAHARKVGAEEWITGGGWDEQQWAPAVPPSRQLVDAITPENPVFVSRLDIHMGLANGVALQLAGITRETPDPPGGTIVRDAGGEPTGLLKDSAMGLVTRVIPRPTMDDRVRAIRTGLREAARSGVTSFCDMGLSAEAFDDFRAFQQLDRADELTARCWMYFPIDRWERLADLGVERGFGSARLRIAGLKGFSDGSLGSSTAAFREPYEDDDGGRSGHRSTNRGLLMAPMLDGSMAEFIAGADERALQLAIHAIGDRANDEVLSIVESLPPNEARRFRIEHAQHLDASLIRRFAASQVIASAQPYHAADDGRWAETKIGAARVPWAFPFRSLLDAGVHLTFGSDWPVAPLDPIAGIHAAVTRRTFDGRNPEGWVPEQKIEVAEALRCYTANSAWAVFAEREIGTIAPGMRADLVVLSENLFEIPATAIESVRVALTMVDGALVYEE